MTPISRLFDFPYYQLEKNNIPNCLVTKYDGKWVATSTQEYIDKANTISRALLRLGVEKNDKIAIISSNNRTEWNIMDIGCLQNNSGAGKTGSLLLSTFGAAAGSTYVLVLDLLKT